MPCQLFLSDEGDVDEIAVREEMARMRDTVMAEADTDKDGLISELEFLELTKRSDFDDNAAWDPLFVSGRKRERKTLDETEMRSEISKVIPVSASLARFYRGGN